MRVSFLIAGFLFCSFSFFSCKKKVKEQTQKEGIMAANAGFISVDINDKHWDDVVVLATYDRPYNGLWTLSVETFTGDLSGGGLSISRIDCTKPQKKIYSSKSRSWLNDQISSTATFTNAEDDMGYNRYDVIEDSVDNNWVKIESFDSAANKAKGTFQVSMYKVSGQTLPGYADTMKFKGSFDVKIKK